MLAQNSVITLTPLFEFLLTFILKFEAPVGQPVPAPPTYVKINGRQVSAADLADLLEFLNGVNWPQFSSAFGNSINFPFLFTIPTRKKKSHLTISIVHLKKAASGQTHPAGFGHSSYGHGHGHENPTASNPGSQKINIGGRDLDVAHVAHLLEHMGDIDWGKVEKSIGNHF